VRKPGSHISAAACNSSDTASAHITGRSRYHGSPNAHELSESSAATLVMLQA
jgi:hypothetical protein